MSRKHELKIMDVTGHSTVTWTTDNEIETKEAKAAFDKAVREGMMGYKVTGPGEGEKMDTWDPEAREIIMSPQLRGG